MISLLTHVHIIDNSGGLIGRCIKILSPHNRNFALLGDLILISLVKTTPSSNLHKGDIFKAVVVRTKSPYLHLSFPHNAVLLVKVTPKSLDFSPLGTTLKGPLPLSLNTKLGCSKLLALAGAKRTIA
jgi:large subunit ribosomal protein L14